ncbi:MAG: 7-carboxy-7-deazaguanine synthase [Deltaproteobacteria bacterium]|nr:7-carboxy-7-deazaguanine synthase [Deltaproteobacteria bacterium]
MSYAVKEIYYTLQGEGANTGRAAVFLRFAGCNLWTGREEDRAQAVCQFCDTDFFGTDGPGGGKFASAQELAAAVHSTWRMEASGRLRPLVVCTGGEPMLQLDEPLVAALHEVGFEVAVESNGTIPAVAGIDWLCVSPKANAQLVQLSGDELKLVYRQVGGEPERYAALDFRHFFLQPMDGPEVQQNTEMAARYCLEHPQWRLSLQTHKLVGLP